MLGLDFRGANGNVVMLSVTDSARQIRTFYSEISNILEYLKEHYGEDI